MPKAPARRHRLLLSFWLSVGLTTLFVQAVNGQEQGGYVRKVPYAGRVIKVVPNTPAEAAGVQVMDLLSKYGEFTVVDHSTYYKARQSGRELDQARDSSKLSQQRLVTQPRCAR
jgi:hypothetical protein